MFEDHAAVGQIRQCARCRHCVQVPKIKAKRKLSLRWLILGSLLCIIAATGYWIYQIVVRDVQY